MPGEDTAALMEAVIADAAAALGELDQAGLTVSEKRLVAAVAAAVKARGIPTATGRHLPVPSWTPRPGGTDLLIGAEERPSAIAELKVSRPGRQPTLHEILWDAIKLSSQLGPGSAKEPRLAGVQGAFLITAAPADHWSAATRDTWHLGARELFPEPGTRFADSTLAIFERQRCGWEDALWGGRGRPVRISERLATEGIAQVRFRHQGLDWELRCARILPSDDERILFANEWPVRKGRE